MNGRPSKGTRTGACRSRGTPIILTSNNHPRAACCTGCKRPLTGVTRLSATSTWLTTRCRPRQGRASRLHVRQDVSRNTAGQTRPTATTPRLARRVGAGTSAGADSSANTTQSLYLGRRYAPPSSYIVELPNDEGEALLDELWAHATRDELTWTHIWRPGDLLMWDNR